MPKVLTDGKVKIGAYKFHDRKKPCLCIEDGNKITIYGYFNSVEGAEEFVEKLGRMVQAQFDGERKDDGLQQ